MKVKLSTDHQLAKVGNDDLKISMSQEDKQNLDTKVNQYVERSNDGLFYCNVCGKSVWSRIMLSLNIWRVLRFLVQSVERYSGLDLT